MFNHTTEVLPIEALLPDLLETLGSGTRCILEAAPGAGKTTRVPLALLRAAWLDGKGILMLEPRRMAARNAARYMASLLGEKVGQTVGYRVRLDSRVSASTRITVVTEGVLTRMLQDDPDLQGVGCLIFDEFHERSLNADLGLALALDCQQGLRDDLRLLIMSATWIPGRSSSCNRISGRSRCCGARARVARGTTSSLPGTFQWRWVADAVPRRAEENGSILVFCRERARTQRYSRRAIGYRTSCPLYGELPAAGCRHCAGLARYGDSACDVHCGNQSDDRRCAGGHDSGLARTVRF
ncbi:MAG: DEAD/DEAH box helicase [Bilophila wadsworthia]